MDSHHAIIVGKENMEDEAFVALGTVDNPGSSSNSSENAANKQEIALTHKFFKEIAAIMPNVDEVHVTGTGQIQEQFIHFLADTPQYKNAVSTTSTSNKVPQACSCQHSPPCCNSRQSQFRTTFCTQTPFSVSTRTKYMPTGMLLRSTLASLWFST
jgi:hypothetical protein